MNRDATWRLVSPAGVGAVAIIELAGEGSQPASELQSVLERLGLGDVPLGRCVLRDILGIDRGLVARAGDRVAWLMPHGGVGVVRALAAELSRRGVAETRDRDPRIAFPEAGDAIEARMLAALARSRSPLAVELLLDQPRRWRESGATRDPARDRVLGRLLKPPLVAAVGASNIGKSTLLNALAGRGVSIVADEPGTTRDHVGVVLDLAGLWVRFVDTPGLREGLDTTRDAAEIEASAAARTIVAGADLVLSCGDPDHPPREVTTRGTVLRVCLRADLGVCPWECDCRVSVRQREGVEELVRRAREALVPTSVLEDAGPWAFWEPLAEGGRTA